MTAKTGKYSGDQLLRAISHDKNPTTLHFMYFPHHKLEANQVINRLTCILSEGIIINTKNSIRISGIESNAVDIWDHQTKGA